MRKALVMLAGALLFPALCFGEYRPEEICVIPWGNGPDSLPCQDPVFIDTEGGAGYFEPSDSPRYAFIDKNEKIYIVYDQSLRVFNNKGKCISVFDSSNFKYDDIWTPCTGPVFVDSLGRLYCVSQYYFGYLGRSGLYVFDSSGAAIRKIPLHSGRTNVARFNYNSNDILTLVDYANHYYTLRGDSVYDGGGYGWLARDAHYYYISNRDSVIKLIRHKNPNLYGWGTVSDTLMLDFGGSRTGARVLGIDDSMRIYIESWNADSLALRHKEIDILDTTLTLKDAFTLPLSKENKYLYWIWNPLCFHTNGTIYEIRIMDDGLHVVRWSKDENINYRK